ncbi:MAG: hypothetical protein HIU90_08465 [Proteobacteria bacterium]|nr:hypothetical protein [Pseudomonadota bacterium]
MNPEATLDPREFRAVIEAARRLRTARAGLIRRQIARLRAELADIAAEQERLAIGSLMMRRSIDPSNPFRTASIAADIADLIPAHPAIDATLADREAERAERAARAVLQFPSPHLAPNNLEASP